MIFWILLFSLSSGSTNEWIWYREDIGTTTPGGRDTTKYVYEGLEIPQPESLCIEENAPPVVKELLKNPTLKNAEEYVKWQAALLERAARVGLLVEKAAVALGVGGTREKVRKYKEKEEEKRLEEIKGNAMLVALLSNDIESQYMITELENLYINGFFVYAFCQDTAYNAVFPIKKYKGQLNFLEGRDKPPLVVFFQPTTRRYQILTRKFATANDLQKSIISLIIKDESRRVVP
ncbi:MAG: hypothetical protein JW740_02745 [Candidatus Zambryskibacteria bacterium]|nr:hypothetical protein [Candidatus Zambryskibacteria bacterium]